MSLFMRPSAFVEALGRLSHCQIRYLRSDRSERAALAMSSIRAKPTGSAVSARATIERGACIPIGIALAERGRESRATRQLNQQDVRSMKTCC